MRGIALSAFAGKPAIDSRAMDRGRDVQDAKLTPRALLHTLGAAATFGRAVGAAAWAFVSSRRWLLAVVLATCGLMGVLSLQKPKHVVVAQEPDEPETKFDEVTRLGSPSGAGGSWLHRWTADANSEKAVAGVTLEAPPADDSEPPDSSRITRRLDAVRSRQSKGAFLTGTIDVAGGTARQSSNAPLRKPAQVQLPQTADASLGSLNSTPDSIFR